jgi:hypothetical protein
MWCVAWVAARSVKREALRALVATLNRPCPSLQAKEKSCGKGGCRYSISAGDLVKLKTAPANYPKWVQARSLYQKLQSIVFSREFESALFKKLGVTKGVKAREFRILSDKHGYSNGRIHTDLKAQKVRSGRRGRAGRERPDRLGGAC